VDAVCLNFVVTYFEHYDNNGQKDFKVGRGQGAGAEWERVGCGRKAHGVK